jgi:hypothetical protein
MLIQSFELARLLLSIAAHVAGFEERSVNQMSRPSRSKGRSPRRPAANATGVPQILLGQKTVRELKILARLAASGANPSRGLARLKKAA